MNEAKKSNTINVKFVEPLTTLKESQSSCEIRFGPKMTEVTVKVYGNEPQGIVISAMKAFETAMKKVNTIDKKYRK